MTPEVNSDHSQYFPGVWLDEHGYYVYTKESGIESKSVRLFLNWIIVESGVS